jgi:hypothetical protein
VQQEAALSRRLSAHLTGRLIVTITDNRAVMISVHRDPSRREFRIRLHRVFLDLPDELWPTLARYVELDDPSASRTLSRFIADNDERIDPPLASEHAEVLRPAGRHHDLAAILRELNARYFSGQAEAQITWGRTRRSGSAKRSIRLGSYCVETRIIRVHPGLDQAWVPRIYVEWVVFHELLHCVHPIPVVNGRRVFHSEAFARDEQRYEHRELAIAWERRNVAALFTM